MCNSFQKLLIVIFLWGITSNTFAQRSLESKIDSVNSIPYDYIVSNIHKSIKIFETNLDRAEKINYPKGIAFSNYNLGLAYYISGKYDKSTSSYLNAIKLFENLGLRKDHAETLGEFGYQLKRRDLGKANLYMIEGINIAETNKFDTVLAKLYDNYGVLKEMEGNLDSAMFFYNQSLKIKLNLNDSLGIPYSLNKIAGIYSMRGNYDKALSVMKKSDLYRDEEEGEFGKIENLVMYGDIYRSKGNIPKAIEYFENALNNSIKEEINYLIRYCYQQLTDLYKLQGNYKKALAALNSYTIYKDSVLNEEVRLKVAELEIDYQTEKKDREIAENKLEISEKTSQLYLLLGIIFLLLFLSFIIFVYQKRKRERLVLEGKLKQAELENKLSEEQLRISRELHDNIGSQITFMISSIDNFIYKSEDRTGTLNKISDFGRDALKELRNTIWALKHGDSDLNELVLKVKELVQKINSTLSNVQVKVNSATSDKTHLSTVEMLNLFRITQEAIQNAVKHSKANEININLNSEKSRVTLVISDNGNGFDLTKVEAGNGLESMQKRCEDCGGKFDIYSSSSGTTVKCEMKIK